MKEDAGKWLSQVKDAEGRAGVEAFLNGESGVEPTALVFFAEGYSNYLTGMAADPAKFKAYVKKVCNAEFSASEGVEIAAAGGNAVALKGNQFWISLSRGSIEAKDINHFVTLSESQSFLANSYSSELTVIGKDVQGWGDIAGLMNTGGVDFRQRAMLQMVMQTIFEDAADFCFSLEFSKGELAAAAQVLNSKGKPAKYILPAQKIDEKTLQGIGGKADMLAALSIPGKLVEKLRKDLGDKVPYLDALSALDGTAGVATGADGRDVKGVLTTKGDGNGQLLSLLSMMDLTATSEGRLVKIAKGNVTGRGDVSAMASDLKGSLLGVCSYTEAFGSASAKAAAFPYFCFRMAEQGGGVECSFKVRTSEPDVNSFITLLKAGAD